MPSTIAPGTPLLLHVCRTERQRRTDRGAESDAPATGTLSGTDMERDLMRSIRCRQRYGAVSVTRQPPQDPDHQPREKAQLRQGSLRE